MRACSPHRLKVIGMAQFGQDHAQQCGIREVATDDRISEVVHCAKGNLVAYMLKSGFNAKTRTSQSHLWLHMPGDMKSTQMTRGASVAGPFCFATDLPGCEDSLLFLKACPATQTQQVWALPLSGGESVQVTALPLAVDTFKVFLGRDRQIWLLVSMEVLPGCTPSGTAAMVKQQEEESESSGVVFDRLMVRHWDTWGSYTRRSHLFLYPLAVSPHGLPLLSPSSRGIDLMPNWESDCPGKPSGSAEAYCPSPCGGWIAFAARRTVSGAADEVAGTNSEGGTGKGSYQARAQAQARNMAWSTESSVFVCRVPLSTSLSSTSTAIAPADAADSSDAAEVIAVAVSPQNGAHHGSPVWSPDSKFLAFLGMARAGYESDRMDVLLWRLAGGEDATISTATAGCSSSSTTNLTAQLDLSFGSLSWPRQDAVWATAQMCGCSRIFRLGLSEAAEGCEGCKVSSCDYMAGNVSRSQPLLLAVPDAVLVYGQHEDTRRSMQVANGCSSTGAGAGAGAPASSEYLYYLESSMVAPAELRRTCLIPPRADPRAFVPFALSASGRYPLIPVSPGIMPLAESSVRGTQQVACPCPQYSNGDVIMSDVQQFYFCPVSPASASTDPDAARQLVHAYFLPPPGTLTQTPPDKSIPVVLLIHGGPQGAWCNAWSHRWNPALYAAQGYAVVMINFTGSTGYGRDFCDAIRGDWGGQPYRDLLEGLSQALTKFTYLDGDRVGALGASYGGYMINWINGAEGHGAKRREGGPVEVSDASAKTALTTPNLPPTRFKCLVNHDGIFSLRGLYFTTEELWFPEWDFCGMPPQLSGLWPEPGPGPGAGAKAGADLNGIAAGESFYVSHSPDTYAFAWRTPTLVIQGGLDYRVCETEALSTFTALQRRSVPSQLLYFPDENHWCCKAGNSIKWHETVFAWLRRWM